MGVYSQSNVTRKGSNNPQDRVGFFHGTLFDKWQKEKAQVLVMKLITGTLEWNGATVHDNTPVRFQYVKNVSSGKHLRLMKRDSFPKADFVIIRRSLFFCNSTYSIDTGLCPWDLITLVEAGFNGD